MLSPENPQLSRNYGFWSEAEQKAIIAADVALAGVGGDGYLLGLSLARMGVGRFRIADPEVFEAENINRVPGATHATVDCPKVDCFVDDARRINPEIEVQVYRSGVTEDNVAPFLEGADLVIDESELTRPEIGTLIADRAESLGLANLQVMNIGFAGQVTAFHPARRPGFREMVGIDRATPLNEVAQQGLDFGRVLPFLPPYVDVSVFAAVVAGASLPSIVPGVNVAAALGASQAFLHLVAGVEGSQRPEPVWYPEVLYLDALAGEALRTDGSAEGVAAAHQRSLATMMANSENGLVTPLRYPRPVISQHFDS